MRLALIALIALSCWSCQDYFFILGEVKVERTRGDDLKPGRAEPAKPAAPDLDLEKQRQTVKDIRNLGTALYCWLTDEVGAAAAGKQERLDLQLYPSISRTELEKLLVPEYLDKIPETDGWGHPFDVRLNVKDPQARNVMSIRSPGRDGSYSEDVYKIDRFDPVDYDQDLVWADGFFIRWPERRQ